MNYFLKIDYILSIWFSKTKDKIIPGTAFLFLNKVAFIWASLFFAITGILNVKMRVELYVGILVFIGAIIMYGFQKKLEKFIEELDLQKTYDKSKNDVKKRWLGMIYFASTFFLIFISIMIFH